MGKFFGAAKAARKLCGFFLAVSLVTLLSACGNDEPAPATDPTPTEAPAATATPVPEATPTVEPVSANETEVTDVPAADDGSALDNLFAVSAAEKIGMPAAGGAWTQADIISLDEETRQKFRPGSVIEIEYRSDSGRLWLVFNHAKTSRVKDEKGKIRTWVRVGAGTVEGCGDAVLNGARNVMQLSFSQIAEIMGEQTENWGDTIQAESDGDWEVLSIRIGTASTKYTLKNAAEVGQEAKGEGWESADIISDITDEAVAERLRPGSVIEITYTSETGELWLVMPEAASGEGVRVGVKASDDDQRGYAICDGQRCFIPYDLIVQYCGADPAAWGSRMQAEASSRWEVTGVRIGEAVPLPPLNYLVHGADDAASESGSATDVFDLTRGEVAAALVPGSMIEISLTADSGDVWLVLPDAGASPEDGTGGSRVVIAKDGESGRDEVIFDGMSCRIPFELIARYCGEDVSSWGSILQLEGSSGWQLKSIAIGKQAQ